MTTVTLVRDTASDEFFEGTARGELPLRRCADCGTWSAPRTRSCPSCRSGRLAWEPVRGTGKLVSWTVVHGRPVDGGPAPRTVAGLVELDEGPWLHARIDGTDPGHLRAGLPLAVAFDRSHGGDAAPVFRPVD
ncbi:OB-fold domain-containing protein [Streptomyces sp. NPDC005435]|uniref:Zn-ribbon domain-containing OB-fold protein n=1 Tax=Streptomyces sp. NPDC005435 TaxID=3154464 RepID=UPI0034553DFC